MMKIYIVIETYELLIEKVRAFQTRVEAVAYRKMRLREYGYNENGDQTLGEFAAENDIQIAVEEVELGKY